MTSFAVRHPRLDNVEAQENLDDLLGAVNQISQFLYWGTGVPTFTPTGRALFIRIDGGAGTSLYVYEGAAWAGK